MIIKNDGSWDPVGSEFREQLHDEFKDCGENCVYVDGVGVRGHRTANWEDHDAIHALFVAFPHIRTEKTDIPVIREALKDGFEDYKESYDEFEDARDIYADARAIVAMRVLEQFRPTIVSTV